MKKCSACELVRFQGLHRVKADLLVSRSILIPLVVSFDDDVDDHPAGRVLVWVHIDAHLSEVEEYRARHQLENGVQLEGKNLRIVGGDYRHWVHVELVGDVLRLVKQVNVRYLQDETEASKRGTMVFALTFLTPY